MAIEKVVVHVDGGSRGNPGPAGVGAVAMTDDGEELAERAAYIGEATNNVAEYRAVLLGIELARQLEASSLALVNDSEVVARQITGEYKVKQAHLKPLRAEVIDALQGFEKWSIESVPREQNERADELYNEALDEELGR